MFTDGQPEMGRVKSTPAHRNVEEVREGSWRLCDPGKWPKTLARGATRIIPSAYVIRHTHVRPVCPPDSREQGELAPELKQLWVRDKAGAGRSIHALGTDNNCSTLYVMAKL